MVAGWAGRYRLTISLCPVDELNKEFEMAKPLVSDELWTRIEPLIPKHHSPTEKGGRPPVDGILRMSQPTPIAFGTKAKVTSWIWVAD